MSPNNNSNNGPDPGAVACQIIIQTSKVKLEHPLPVERSRWLVGGGEDSHLGDRLTKGNLKISKKNKSPEGEKIRY